jgi:hypothetical protein
MDRKMVVGITIVEKGVLFVFAQADPIFSKPFKPFKPETRDCRKGWVLLCAGKQRH